MKGPLDKKNNFYDPELTYKMRNEIQNLLAENRALNKKLEYFRFTPKSLKGNESMVKHYTGLSYPTLMCLFNFLSPHISEIARSSLTKFEKLMIVLMKLRLNLSIQDLSHRFNVTHSCISKNCNKLIDIMYFRLKFLIFWPERKELQTSMPMEFRKHFGLKVSIIIDCFEIFIERPSNFLARAQTWSNYKHHNTAKYLIGITPQGAVSFLSKGYGGRTTDKFLTDDCGLLNNLLPGDMVLADRGFNIEESVGFHCAEVKISAFTRGKKQLSPLEIEQTRKIAHTRIEVERVIGLVRNKFTILRNTIPIDYLYCDTGRIPTLDKICTVCCALSNMCKSVVSFD